MNDDIGHRLAGARLARWLGIVRACEIIGDIQPSELSAYERGFTVPSPETVDRIFAAYSEEREKENHE